ncbi:MAG: TolC family protein [Lachnospiraceae bacterium]
MTKKNKRRVWSAAAATLIITQGMPQVYAASPEFARTDAEWARLQDDLIEYDELADLIKEYNATVQKNQIDLNEFRKDYGDTNEKWANRYRELADEIESNLDYPDSGDSDYATAMMTIISQESQIDNLREQADDALDDIKIQYLTFQSAEAALVSVAQSQMMSYYQNQVQLEICRLNQALVQESYQAAVNQWNAGVATEIQVLTAEESLRSMDQSALVLEQAIEQGRQKLFVLLGWKHNDSPQIGELPKVTLEQLGEIDPAADKTRALENNYTLNINKRKLENAKNADKIESLEKSIRENEQNISASLTAYYQNAVSAGTAYRLAESQNQLEQQNYRIAEQYYSLGSISRLEYLTQKTTTETARLQVDVAQINLLQAMETYWWAVNGLADA